MKKPKHIKDFMIITDLSLGEKACILEYGEQKQRRISKPKHINKFILCHLPLDWFQDVFKQ